MRRPSLVDGVSFAADDSLLQRAVQRLVPRLRLRCPEVRTPEVFARALRYIPFGELVTSSDCSGCVLIVQLGPGIMH